MARTKLAALLAASMVAGATAFAVTPVSPDQQVPTAGAQTALDSLSAMHPGTAVMRQGDQIARIYGEPFSHGSSPAESADAFIAQHAGVFGVNPADLAPIGPFEDGAHLMQIMPDREVGGFKFTGVYYQQQVSGVPVFRGGLIVLTRNMDGFPAVLASSTLWDATNLYPLVSGKNLRKLPSADVYTSQALNYFDAQPNMFPAQYVIWAGVDRVAAVSPRLAVQFEAEGGNPMLPGSYQRILFVVDAANGAILYQESRVYEAISGQVKLNATPGWNADPCAVETPVGMPYAEIKQGANTYYADANGFFNIPTTGTLSYTTRTAGQFFTCSDNGAAPISETATVNSGDTWNPILNAANASEEDRAEVNAYLHANIVRDMVLGSNPSYPSVSTQTSSFPITVNITVDTCNAYYSGSTINFYHSGGGCNNLAFGTVVHHEYGHNVVEKGGSGQGAYGEGMGDVCAVLCSNTSIMGVGFSTCSGGIRNANNTCQYSGSCSSCGSAIHSCGQLISGCVWSLRNEFIPTYPADYLSRVADLAINSVLLHGAISTIAADIVVDYVTLDDDNGDITDGTPNYSAIADAFGAHNLPAPALAPLKFNFPNGLPTMAHPAGGTQIAFNVQALGSTPQPGSGKAFVKMQGAGSYTEVPVTSAGANSYILNFPAGTCGGVASYYFQAMSTAAETVRNPISAPTTAHSTIMATGLTTFTSDTFEASSGWLGGIAGDTATSGVWTRADPVGTSAQPEDDHTTTPGVACWVTGNATPGAAIGTNDIDGGVTTLLSPSYNLATAGSVMVSYWRWYSNDQGSAPNADTMPIEVSNNNGNTWVTMEAVSENANAWVFKQLRVNDFVAPSAQMRFRVRAQDTGSGSLVEAAFDDFKLTVIDCTEEVFGDLNGDGLVDGADLGTLLGNWGLPGGSDLNGDGTTDGADLGALLGAWTI